VATIEHFVEQFRQIQPKFSRLYTRMLNQAHFTQPQYALLLELLQAAPHPMTMTAISHKLYITKPAVTSLVDRLEKNGLIKRVDCPKDRRISFLQIQPKGKKIVEEMQGKILNLFRDAAKKFTGEERETVERFYSIISESIDDVLHCPKGSRSCKE
jgi:MarR family transcriptional regulator, 2-MHQ and catechol-resistance regulon repressor